MRPQSAKAKGRRLQQHVANVIKTHLDLPDSDVKSLPMGSQGMDIWLSARAQELCPLAIECKNVEKLNIWAAIKQAESNCGELAPAVVFSRNNQEPFIALPLEALMYILSSRAELLR